MIKVTLANQDDNTEIRHFMRMKYRLCKDWEDNFFKAWLTWYIAQGLCVIGRDIIVANNRNIFGHIEALLMGRPIKEIQDVFQDTYALDYNGDTFFVDIYISPSTTLLPTLTAMMIASVGIKKYLAFTRDHGTMRKVKKYQLTKLLHYYAPIRR